MMLVEETAIAVAQLPIARFRDHLRLGSGFADDDLQDNLLESHLRASIAAIEARTGKILLERSFCQTVSRWNGPSHVLPVAPVSAIISLSLIDLVGQEAAVDPALWFFQADAQRPRVCPAVACLPTIPRHGTAKLRFWAGFGPEWSDTPDDLAQAVFLLAAHFYEYRHAYAQRSPQLPHGVQALVAPYRAVRMTLGGGA